MSLADEIERLSGLIGWQYGEWLAMKRKLDRLEKDAALGVLVRRMQHDDELRHGAADITRDWVFLTVDNTYFGKTPEEALGVLG